MFDLTKAEDMVVSGNRIILSEEQKRIVELEAENAKLRQQRDAANAQLDWLIEQTGTKRVIRSNMDECD